MDCCAELKQACNRPYKKCLTSLQARFFCVVAIHRLLQFWPNENPTVQIEQTEMLMLEASDCNIAHNHMGKAFVYRTFWQLISIVERVVAQGPPPRCRMPMGTLRGYYFMLCESTAKYPFIKDPHSNTGKHCKCDSALAAWARQR